MINTGKNRFNRSSLLRAEVESHMRAIKKDIEGKVKGETPEEKWHLK